MRYVWLHAFKLVASLFLFASVLLHQAACFREDHGNIVVTRDVDFLTEFDYPDDKDKLDIFMPRDSVSAAVIIFFHGGALQHGDKSHGELLAMRFVPEGIGIVSANYRLSPGVMHPAHIQDAAAAFAWVIKNINRYGGDPNRVYVSGHSAGAYLATLLALDPAYLAANDLGPGSVRGTIAISPFLYVEETARVRPKTVWGENPKAWMNASVTPHIKPGKGPILLIYADNDAEWRRDQIITFGKAMQAAGNRDIRVVQVPNRGHTTLLTHMNRSDDQIGRLVLSTMMEWEVKDQW